MVTQLRTGLRADLYRTRDYARTVGDSQLEIQADITIILYLCEDPDTGHELNPPDTWEFAAKCIRQLLELDST